ncbi:flagellar biosynthetic protein FliO [Pseudomonas fluorescens]|uniref:flagellar biosynthetic protein FliO n=1 Tax=Pseudomonas TaxID=286 RepID=UPI00131B3738|nr:MULTISPECIES: flagellar biosynthetic protein FliO [Pseudomonas]KAE9658641.1 flagellar biosynthetic protein FliO [Pseudomonas sp. PB105]MBD8190790.1 flagellar biosynthetic protein FliO [Pseudomonas fluorescens]MBD8225416.1 flagellar biosynthetic protein FliO [Pseudomonas fluorescens]MBD8786160.1 flagellar biosynthetic protein FliO [Pseudomonas fluorescens]MBD8815961.1 flagellar biosynthetic protein FliO [Pseudomonas fluorescens]
MKRLMVGLWVALPLSAWAAEPVAQAAVAAAPVGSGLGGQLTQLVLGLLLVVGLIFVLAWLLRRVQQVGPGNAQVIEMIGSRALGPRDRLVLVQVGEEQILLGLTPGRITPLHVLKTPVNVDQSKPATPEFAQRLMELLGKDQKDTK